MTLQSKRYLIGFLGLLFLASLVLVQAMEIARKGVGCVECHQAQKGNVDGFTHYGHLIATVVTPQDCGRCHEKETNEFTHSHHAKAGNILASLDNFLADL